VTYCANFQFYHNTPYHHHHQPAQLSSLFSSFARPPGLRSAQCPVPPHHHQLPAATADSRQPCRPFIILPLGQRHSTANANTRPTRTAYRYSIQQLAQAHRLLRRSPALRDSPHRSISALSIQDPSTHHTPPPATPAGHQPATSDQRESDQLKPDSQVIY
jgi:hypothetical protein